MACRVKSWSTIRRKFDVTLSVKVIRMSRRDETVSEGLYTSVEWMSSGGARVPSPRVPCVVRQSSSSAAGVGISDSWNRNVRQLPGGAALRSKSMDSV